MPHDPHAPFDETVLDLIDHSATGAVPGTPSHQDALNRLRAAHKVYPDADHKDGYVTARALASRPSFHAANLDELMAGRIPPEALEPNAAIFDRYVRSLPVALQARAEAVRLKVVGRVILHRAKTQQVHDPLHSLFLVPGAGPHPGLPGNYLYGQIVETGAPGSAAWALQVHDRDDGVAVIEEPTLAAVLAHLQEVLGAAPFAMDELEALGFRMV